jgi:hypothetical protein
VAKVKAEINKSEAIRNIYAQNPGASPKSILTQLKSQGIEASEGLIYSLKPGTKKKRKESKGKAKVAPTSNGALLSIGASIAVAKAAADKIGLAALKEIVDALQ